MLDQGGRSAPSVSIAQGAGDLREFVEHVATDLVGSERKAPTNAREWRVVADDCAHLIWSRTLLNGTERDKLLLVGPRTAFADIARAYRIATVGIRLRAGAAKALFGIPAAELADTALHVSEIGGRRGAEIERQTGSSAPQDVPALLTAFISEKARCGCCIDPRTAHIAVVAARSGTTADTVARDANISSRTLRAIAAAELGMGLNRFLRIRRVHRAIASSLRRPGHGWSRIAAGCGYADQAHLIKDFHAFLGETPREFMQRGFE